MPVSPLRPAQLRRALRFGHGRALLHARHYGLGDGLDIFLAACLEDRRYDPQIDSYRAPWLIWIADEAGRESELLKAVVSSLLQPYDEGNDIRESSFNCRQQCAIAHTLARRGHTEAARALRAAFGWDPYFNDFRAWDEILDLDGESGLVWMAETAGRLAGRQPDVDLSLVNARELFENYDQQHGPDSANKILSTNPSRWVRFFLNGLEPPEPASSSLCDQPPGPRPAEELIHGIETEPTRKIRYGLGSWGRRLGPAGLEPVLAAMASETHPRRLSKYLMCFSQFALPAVPELFLRLAGHSDRNVREAAAMALQHYSDPRVRRLGFEAAASKAWVTAVKMLRLNFEPGDESLLLGLPRSEKHSFISSLMDLLQANQRPELAEICRGLYNLSHCGYCRRMAVEWLLEMGCLPDEIAEEAICDADDLIREVLRRKSLEIQ